MTTDIQNFDSSLIPADLDLVNEQSNTAVDEVMQATLFLPRIQLMALQSDMVVTGKASAGNFYLIWTKERAVDMVKEWEALALSFRPKAVRCPPGGAAPIAYYDVNSKEFQDAKAVAEQPGMNGCFFGPEFLVWLPVQKEFATFLCGNGTLRRIAPRIVQLMRNEVAPGQFKVIPALFRSRAKLIDNGKNKWWGAEIFPSSSQLPAPPDDFTERVREEVMKFKNPPKSQVEEVKQEAATDRAR